MIEKSVNNKLINLQKRKNRMLIILLFEFYSALSFKYKNLINSVVKPVKKCNQERMIKPKF